MSYENKGTVSPTIIISREPDRSGNLICDGTADDVQIQAAHDQLSSGGKIFIKKGTYNISANLAISTAGITIEGEDRNRTILDGLTTTDRVFDVTGDYFTLRNLRITRGEFRGIHTEGLYGTYRNLLIDNILGTNGLGFKISSPGEGGGAGHNTLDNIIITDTDTHGIDDDHSGGYNTISNCEIRDVGDTGMQCYGVNHTTWTNIVVVNATNDGGSLVGGQHCVYSNITIDGEGTGDNGFFLGAEDAAGQDCTGNIIQGLTIYNTIEEGFYVGGTPAGTYETYGNVITGLVVRGMTGVGNFHCIHIVSHGDRPFYENIIQGFELDGAPASGIRLRTGYVYDNVFADGIITDAVDWGIAVRDSTGPDRNTFTNIELDGCEFGVWLNDDSDSNIFDDIRIKSLGGTTAFRNFNEVATNTILRDWRMDDPTKTTEPIGASTYMREVHLSLIDATEWQSTAPFGGLIDDATDYVIGTGHIPNIYNKVVRIRVFGVALAADADSMNLELEAYGWADNLPYTSETVTIANWASTTTGFAVNDGIFWIAIQTDDTDIDEIYDGYSIAVKVIYAGVDGDNIATDVLITSIVIDCM